MRVDRSFLRPALGQRWICADCSNRLYGERRLVQQRRSISRNHIRRIITAEEEWNLRKADIHQGKRKSMLQVLEERGFVNQIVGTREGLDRLLTEKRVGVYAGVDPTAPSLHVGHMVPFMALGWMYIYGYAATFLMGGFTASVGDPIGRLSGRDAQSSYTRTANATAMHLQLKKLGSSMHQYAMQRGYHREWAWRRTLLNNYNWWQKVTVKDFMKVLGSGTRIGPMLGRDTVKNRLDAGEGMSLAEFTYPLIQAWDWWQMFQTGTQVQIGGADQFGNILAGAEAVKYLAKNDPEYLAEQTRTGPQTIRNSDAITELASLADSSLREPMGFTVPLLTTASGEKFGKSAGNAVWLDPSMTSSFDLYQFFLRSADADVERYLKLFTFLPLSEIESIMVEQQKDESKRVAQHKLAAEFVELVHGKEAAAEATKQHSQLFNSHLTLEDIRAQIQVSRYSEMQTTSDGRPIDVNPLLNKTAKPLDMHTGGDVNIKLPQSLVIGQPLSRILWSAELVASRSEGQRMINKKGVYVGGQRSSDAIRKPDEALNFAQIEDSKWSSVEPFVLEGALLILRIGKWRMKVINIVPDEEYAASGQSCPGWNEGGDVEQANANVEELDIYGEEMHRKSAEEKEQQKIQDEINRQNKALRDRARQMTRDKTTT